MLELTEATLIEDAKDIELITKIVQVSFFDDATQEDIRKAIWLLNRYTNMIDLISNYEFVLKEENDGLNEYDLSGAEGRAKRLEVSDTISNVTANTVIMMDQRHDNYLLYKKITNRVQYAVRNIRDPHEGLVSKLLFLDGMKYLKARPIVKRVTEKIYMEYRQQHLQINAGVQ
jgi:hypothetical protein